LTRSLRYFLRSLAVVAAVLSLTATAFAGECCTKAAKAAKAGKTCEKCEKCEKDACCKEAVKKVGKDAKACERCAAKEKK
jgi:hypothetical protein